MKVELAIKAMMVLAIVCFAMVAIQVGCVILIRRPIVIANIASGTFSLIVGLAILRMRKNLCDLKRKG